MAGTLGYGGVGTRETVWNPSTTVTIAKGESVELLLAEAKIAPNTGEPVATVEQANAVGHSFYGVATGDIPPESFGEIVYDGPVLVKPKADAIVVGQAIGPDASGEMDDDSTVTIGILLQASGAANQDLKLASVCRGMGKSTDIITTTDVITAFGGGT